MSEDNAEENEEEKKPEDALDVAESDVDENEIDDDDVLTEDEVAKLEKTDEPEEEEPEKGAFLVIGQGDLTSSQANRGADDPSDNTLCEPQGVCKYGQMLFVADRGNHRVLVWNEVPQENGDFANVVLGQEDFSDCLENRGITTTLDEMTSGLGDEGLDDFTISMPDEDTMSAPTGLDVVDGKLYVADSGNHRIIRWAGLPSEDGEAPILVLGQDSLDCGEANRRGFVGSGSLFFPMGVRSGDDQHLFTADKDNHRVLIWNKVPFNNGWNADVCLGQEGMDEREPNRGDFEHVGPETLSFPTGMFFDTENQRVFVVDQGNNRVLIWNRLPSENGTPADVVIGQKDMYSREVNGGLGGNRTSANGFYFPTDVVFGKVGLFISDSNNNRVLYWKEVPTENGQSADLVIGQSDYISNRVNRGGEPTASTLNDPFGLHLVEEGEEDDDEDYKWQLYIADRSNSRVVVWDELPLSPEEDEDEEEEREDFQEDPEMLMGDDDDFVETDEEEEEETPPGEITSA